jgi:hypothetical protein
MAESLLVRKGGGGGLEIENSVEKNYEIASGQTVTKNNFVDLVLTNSKSLNSSTSFVSSATSTPTTICRLTNHRNVLFYTSGTSVLAKVGTFISHNQKTYSNAYTITSTTTTKTRSSAIAISKDKVLYVVVDNNVFNVFYISVSSDNVISVLTSKVITGVGTSQKIELIYLLNRAILVFKNSTGYISSYSIHSFTSNDFTINAAFVLDSSTTSLNTPTACVSSNNRFMVAYTNNSNSTTQIRLYEVSGTNTITLVTGGTAVFSTGDTSSGVAIAPLGENQAVILFKLPATGGKIAIGGVSFFNGTSYRADVTTLSTAADIDNLRVCPLQVQQTPQTTDNNYYYNNFTKMVFYITFTASSTFNFILAEASMNNSNYSTTALWLNKIQETQILSNYAPSNALYMTNYQSNGRASLFYRQSDTLVEYFYQFNPTIKMHSNSFGVNPFGIALEDGTSGQTIKVLTFD